MLSHSSPPSATLLPQPMTTFHQYESATQNHTSMLSTLFLPSIKNKARPQYPPGVKVYQCNLCLYTSLYSWHLKDHYLTHTDFSELVVRQTHTSQPSTPLFPSTRNTAKRQYPPGTKLYSCSQCSYTSVHAWCIKQHNIVHTDFAIQSQTSPRPMLSSTRARQYPPGVKVYNCSICSYTTPYSHCLKQHSVVHTGERPHKCSVCNKGFTQKHVLKTHMLIHTGQKPYKCEVCLQCFRHATSLLEHRQKFMHFPVMAD
ncbi:hypothetical protein JTE90_009456 [Oedothorax gibbosus]|uniref:C2H2-type domain-containing protein n=1 Tax=Oedothorax gibbosus TaxID=931172 RepID=A0AAV6VV21_9ARAC|nr:hypothetical protein JTE90_009456 [Oedothorax gibbosus]